MPSEPGSARRWLAYAHGDLALADAGAAAHVPFLLLCFHAQQAAEKAVKAVLVAHGIEAPRTHNLGILFAGLPVSVAPPEELESMLGLSVYAVAGRYPDEIEEADRQEYTAAVSLARRVVDWADQLVTTEGSGGF